jgi:hypothetical protein
MSLTLHEHPFPSVARVVDEAREFRPVFPLPWPEYAA